MPDILIRDVPEQVLAALDVKAARVGLSRSEFLRRRLSQEAVTEARKISDEDWHWLHDSTADAREPGFLEQAWR